ATEVKAIVPASMLVNPGPVGVVTVTNPDGNRSSAALLVILDATMTGAGTSFSIPRGDTYSGLVGTFTSGNANATSSDFSAVINWGDGTALDGNTTIDTANDQFTVSGSHVYNSVGNFVVTTTITDQAGSQAIITGPLVYSTAADMPVALSGQKAVT